MGAIMIGFLSPLFRQYARLINATSPLEIVCDLDKKSNGSFVLLFEFVQLIVYVIMLAAQFVGMMAFFSYLQGKDDNTAYIIGAACVCFLLLSYSVSGGIRRDMASDLLQFVFLLIGALAIVFVKIGPDSATMSLSPNLLAPSFSTLALCFFVLISLLPTFLVRFDIWQRVLAAKDDNTAKWSFVLSGMLSSAFFVIFGLAGVLASSKGIGKSSFVGLDYLLSSTTDLYHGLIFVCFFAAVLSSADTFLGVSGLSLNGFLNRLQLFPKSLFWINASVLIAGFFAGVLAYFAGDIVMLFSSAFAMLSAFAPPFLIDHKGDLGILRRVNWIVVISLVAFGFVFMLSTNLAFVIPFLVSLIISLCLVFSASGKNRV
jgi:Na+/proline symporter